MFTPPRVSSIRQQSIANVKIVKVSASNYFARIQFLFVKLSSESLRTVNTFSYELWRGKSFSDERRADESTEIQFETINVTMSVPKWKSDGYRTLFNAARNTDSILIAPRAISSLTFVQLSQIAKQTKKHSFDVTFVLTAVFQIGSE